MQPFSIVSENFNGGENNTAEPATLPTFQLRIAENCRLSTMGGFGPRPGYEQIELPSFVGLGPNQGAFSTDDGVFFVNNGNLYIGDENFSDAYIIATGLDATRRCRFFEYNGDVYLMNGEHPRRIVKSTTASTLIAGVSTTLTVQTGQGAKYGNTTGTIVVVTDTGVDSISYTARTNDVFTITAGTVASNAPAGSILLEVIQLTSVPKGTFGTVFQNRWIMGGIIPKDDTEHWNPNVVVYGRPTTGLHPEYFYDFTGTGSGATPIWSQKAVTALFNTKTYLLIGKQDSILYCSGFDSNYDMILGQITDVYGVAGPDAVTSIGKETVVFTGKSVKRVGEQEGLNNTVPSLDAGYDAAFSKYLKNELTADQSEAHFTYNENQELAKLWVTKMSGFKECIVIDNKRNPVTMELRNAWTRDTNKPALFSFIHKGATYWSSVSEPIFFKDETGYSDNGLDILTRVRTGDYSQGQPKLSKYFKTHYIDGRIYEGALITVNIYFDDVLAMSFLLDDSLFDGVASGSIGTVTIGGEAVGGGPTLTVLQGIQFDVEKLLLKRKDTGKMSIEYVCQGQSQIWEISSHQVFGLMSDKFIKKIRI
jgi:hypothetical protein